MPDIVYREMHPGDVPATVALRNEVFADYPVGVDAWRDEGMRAAIALCDHEVIGAIPLAMRQITIAPGVVITAPFENSVGTRADWRSRGIGAGMIRAARDFLQDRADGLFVYRGGERTRGYRFYERTGHYDLLATRSYQLGDLDLGPTAPATVITGREALMAQAEALLSLFASTYAPFGGYPPRTASYWRHMLSSFIFREIPTDFSLIQVHDHGALTGYALVGVRTTRPDGMVHVMEMATRSADLPLATRVLRSVATFASERDLRAELTVSVHDPFVLALEALGATPVPRNVFLMGQLINVPQFFARSWQPRIALGSVGLRVATEVADYSLSEPSAGSPTLTLEMKEATLHGWLLSRVDLAARVREGTVTAYGINPRLLDEVCRAIPWTPWAYHYLDWI